MSEEEKEMIEEIEKEKEEEEKEEKEKGEDLGERIGRALQEEYQPIDYSKVTLDDVLKAIRVLERFMALYRRASSTVIKMQGMGFGGRFNPRDIMSMMMSTMFQQRSIEPAPEDVREVIDTIERKKKQEEK